MPKNRVEKSDSIKREGLTHSCYIVGLFKINLCVYVIYLIVGVYLKNQSHFTPLSEDKTFCKGLKKMCCLHEELASYKLRWSQYRNLTLIQY